MKILIIEDEIQASKKLSRFILENESNADISILQTVDESVNVLSKPHEFNLIFSDIELTDGNAIDIFKQISLRIPVIFCTAYDTYYVEAFETNGIAYLLKPYTIEDFKEVWIKFKTLFLKDYQTDLLDKMNLILNSKSNYKKTISVKEKDTTIIVQMENILYLQSQGDFLIVFTKDNQKYIINSTLQAILEQLDPTHFFQINRSEILHFNAIRNFKNDIKMKLEIELVDNKTKLFTSNSRSSSFRKWVDSH